MQAPSNITTTVTASGADYAADAPNSGQGIRISASARSKTRESLFTSILQHGFSLSRTGGRTTQENVQAAGADDGINEDGDPVDVCGLLMQLTLMNGQQQATGEGGQAGPDESGALSGVSGIALSQSESAEATEAEGASLQGKYQTAAVILQSDTSKAEEVLSEMTAAGTPGLSDGNKQQTDPAGGNGTVLAGITAALRNEAETGARGMAAAQETSGLTLNQGAAAAEARSLNGAAGKIVKAAAVNAQEGQPAAADAAAAVAGTTGGTTQESSAGMSEDSSENSGSAISGGDGITSGGKDDTEAIGFSEDGTAFISAGSAAPGEIPAEKTAAAVKALNSLADDLRSVQSGAQEIKIVLEPESLGVLTISVVKTEAGISAKIKSEDKEVAAAISSQLQRLIVTMESKGIRLNDVDVVYSQAEQGTGFQQQSFTQSGNQSSRGQYTPAQEQNQDGEAQNGGFWQEYYSDDKNGDSVVEYRV